MHCLCCVINNFANIRNAGFDPAVIRVDGYGNVIYYHADSASPLAWDVDHWFPCSSNFHFFLYSENV